MSSPRLPNCYDPERAIAALPPGTSRLKIVGHSLAAVVSLPHRLANPPPKQSKLALRDVLAGRHCSPISLVDFENYLTYTEHSVENLFFITWSDAYTTEYGNADHTDPSVLTTLSRSAASATRTYLEAESPYELNLSEGKRSEILGLPLSPPPLPGAYDVARKEALSLLEDSLRRWEKDAKKNAGWRRLAFSTYCGLINALLTVTAMVLARIYSHRNVGRIVAACLTPWLWFAIVGVVCGLKGVCLLCYSVGGSVRQVSSFELSLPRTSPGHSVAMVGMHSPSIRSVEHQTPQDKPENAKDEAFISPWEATDNPRGNLNSPITPTNKTEHSHDPFMPHSARGSEFIIRDTPNLHNRPTPSISKAKVVKFWAPMVEVEDPYIIRAYWETAMKGFLWSLVPSIPIGVIVASI